eukprot:GHVN01049584.1.p1 GENE.GHVN01049584.1~~GHVN01049584.1.p1  ORF type:complete len:913 (-),score=210.21 GHVN01049584.1:543-2996(-)
MGHPSRSREFGGCGLSPISDGGDPGGGDGRRQGEVRDWRLSPSLRSNDYLSHVNSKGTGARTDTGISTAPEFVTQVDDNISAEVNSENHTLTVCVSLNDSSLDSVCVVDRFFAGPNLIDPFANCVGTSMAGGKGDEKSTPTEPLHTGTGIDALTVGSTLPVHGALGYPTVQVLPGNADGLLCGDEREAQGESDRWMGATGRKTPPSIKTDLNQRRRVDGLGGHLRQICDERMRCLNPYPRGGCFEETKMELNEVCELAHLNLTRSSRREHRLAHGRTRGVRAGGRESCGRSPQAASLSFEDKSLPISSCIGYGASYHTSAFQRVASLFGNALLDPSFVCDDSEMGRGVNTVTNLSELNPGHDRAESDATGMAYEKNSENKQTLSNNLYEGASTAPFLSFKIMSSLWASANSSHTWGGGGLVDHMTSFHGGGDKVSGVGGGEGGESTSLSTHAYQMKKNKMLRLSQMLRRRASITSLTSPPSEPYRSSPQCETLNSSWRLPGRRLGALTRCEYPSIRALISDACLIQWESGLEKSKGGRCCWSGGLGGVPVAGLATLVKPIAVVSAAPGAIGNLPIHWRVPQQLASGIDKLLCGTGTDLGTVTRDVSLTGEERSICNMPIPIKSGRRAERKLQANVVVRVATGAAVCGISRQDLFVEGCDSYISSKSFSGNVAVSVEPDKAHHDRYLEYRKPVVLPRSVVSPQDNTTSPVPGSDKKVPVQCDSLSRAIQGIIHLPLDTVCPLFCNSPLPISVSLGMEFTAGTGTGIDDLMNEERETGNRETHNDTGSTSTGTRWCTDRRVTVWTPPLTIALRTCGAKR